MKQLFFDGKGKLLIQDVPTPDVPRQGALVRVYASLISSGTTPKLIRREPQTRINPDETVAYGAYDAAVTALYGKGLDGHSDPVEYAAIVFAPGVGAPPPVPANLAAATDGLRAPLATDANWFGVVRVSWDKVDDSLPFRVGSYAFARAQQR